jgi:hypothetical protein
MGIDIRLPIGGMFSIFGIMLTIYGLCTHNDAMYQTHSLGINVNFWWGLVMLIFGIVMLLLARHKTKTTRN